MTTIEEVKKAFHKARIEGEKRLQKTTTDAEFRIEWGKFAFVMLGFDTKLRSMGVVL